MISDKLIKEAEDFLEKETGESERALSFLFRIATQQGIRLARVLDADESIVILGTGFMDCMLPIAKRENRIFEHVQMSEDKTRQFLEKHSEIIEKEKDNILHCVREHHGVEKFFSLESEVCCNADCYKFLTVEGVLGSINRLGDSTIEDMVELHLEKAEEKWNALSLDICKKELEPQYKAIKAFLSLYKVNNANDSP